jgi:uncharacterized protein (DUF433 family)
MKPTQEQIEAALRCADETDRMSDAILLNAVNSGRTAKSNALTILAAAYRDLRAEVHDTITENLHLADGDECTLKRLKDAIQYDNL